MQKQMMCNNTVPFITFCKMSSADSDHNSIYIAAVNSILQKPQLA
jgi:hypothetical protein